MKHVSMVDYYDGSSLEEKLMNGFEETKILY